MSELVAGKTVPERLALCRALLEQRVKIRMAPVDRQDKVRIMAVRRMRAVRGILLGSANPSLSDELLTPGGASARLLAAFETLKDAPIAQRVALAQRAKGILSTVRALEHAERFGAQKVIDDSPDGFLAMQRFSDLDGLVNGVLQGQGLQAMDPVVDECIGRGKIGEALRDELAAAKLATDQAKESMSALELALAEKYDVAERQLRELSNRIPTNGDQEAYLAAYSEYMLYRDEVYIKVVEAKSKQARLEQDARKAALVRVGSKMIADMLNQSPVKPDDAARWAGAQEITKPAVARLKKIGYPLDKVRTDMAEFYRLTGGRVSVVRINSKGDRRANATDIASHGKVGTINIDSAFDKRVLWHELAHHLEADPLATASAGRFIRRRSADGRSHSLRSLTGNKGYRSDEVALKGDFFSPYVGKIYSDGMTEVFSMGVETFSDPALLAQRAVDDPQTLEFVAGYLRTPVDPMERAHMELRNALQEIVAEVDDSAESYVATKVQELAARVRFESSADTQWVVDRDLEWHVRGFTMVGNLTQSDTGVVFHVLSGPVRQYGTRRKVTGFKLVERNPDAIGRASGGDAATRDMKVMRAIMALHQRDGYWRSPKDLDNADYLRKLTI